MNRPALPPQVVFIGSRFPPSVLGGLADLLTWLWESASPDTQQRRHASPCRPLGTGGSSLPPLGQGLVHLIGNTPVIRIKSLSEQTGCEVRW